MQGTLGGIRYALMEGLCEKSRLLALTRAGQVNCHMPRTCTWGQREFCHFIRHECHAGVLIADCQSYYDAIVGHSHCKTEVEIGRLAGVDSGNFKPGMVGLVTVPEGAWYERVFLMNVVMRYS